MPIISGDKLYITFPPQVTLPDISFLNIASQARIVDQLSVKDEIQAVINGQTVIITFTKVAPLTGTYMWTVDNIGNPRSLQPSDPFTQIYFRSSDGYFVQEFVNLRGPVVDNTLPAQILIQDLIQLSNDPEQITTYTIWFMPTNPIPPTGSVQIAWPSQVRLMPDVTCTVITGTTYENSCVINPT